MPSPQYEHFKFNVGDLVQPVSIAFGFDTPRNSFTSRGTPVMQVIERIYQECPGGVQLFYKVRGYFGEASAYDPELVMFNEIELLLYHAAVDDEVTDAAEVTE
jgi:hypothetical protein